MAAPNVSSLIVTLSDSSENFTPTCDCSAEGDETKSMPEITPQADQSSQTTSTRRSLPRAAKMSPCYSGPNTDNLIKKEEIDDDSPPTSASTKRRAKIPPSASETSDHYAEVARPELKDLLVNQLVTPRPQADVHFSGFGDIICGRGCGHKTASRLSNLKYRLLLNYHRDLYDGAMGKNDKRLVCELILGHIFDHGGRFVQTTLNGELWETFSYEMCMSKISQSFRDLRTLDCGKSTLDTITLRPGTPTADDLDAWKRLRESIAGRIILGSEGHIIRKPTSPKKKTRKAKIAILHGKGTKSPRPTITRSSRRPSKLVRNEKRVRRVSIDHGGPSPRGDDSSTMTRNYDTIDVKIVFDGTQQESPSQDLSMTPISARERPRRVSIELGHARGGTDQTTVGHGTSGDDTTLQHNLFGGKGESIYNQGVFMRQRSSFSATPRKSNCSPQDEFLTPSLARMLSISPIQNKHSSNNDGISQVTPSSNNESPFKSLTNQLWDFERKQAHSCNAQWTAEFGVVKFGVGAEPDFSRAFHDAALAYNCSEIWDVGGNTEQKEHPGYRPNDVFHGSALLMEAEDLHCQKLQDMLLLSSNSIGEITDTSSSDSLMTNDEMDLSMDWFCTTFS